MFSAAETMSKMKFEKGHVVFASERSPMAFKILAASVEEWEQKIGMSSRETRRRGLGVSKDRFIKMFCCEDKKRNWKVGRRDYKANHF